MHIKSLLFLAALGLAGASARADVILAYEVDGLTGTTLNLIPAVLDPDLTGGTLTRGVGLGATSATAGYSSSAWNITDTFDPDVDFLSVTLDADPGYMLGVNSITYRMTATSTAPNQARWGYSIDGGAWTYQTPYTISSATAGGADNAWTDIGLSSVTAPVEFRFWVWGTTQADGDGAAATGGTVRIRNLAGNDLVFDGTVEAIPEPSSLLLGLLAGLVLFALRRK
jgi:hypothetical protein